MAFFQLFSFAKVRLLLGALAVSGFGLTACQETVASKPDAKILVMGDSMMAWNDFTGKGVPDVMENLLEEPVLNVAVRGAMLIGSGDAAFDIRGQYRASDWDWVVFNGGANDLFFKCSCSKSCEPLLNQMISADGKTGEFPKLVEKIAKAGPKVMVTGYHRARQMNAPLRACGDDLDELDRRLAKMAKMRNRVEFLNLQNVFPAGDTSFYDLDRTHPSPKGSATIAAAIAKELR